MARWRPRRRANLAQKRYTEPLGVHMRDAAPFLGTWTSTGVPPHSSFLFTWSLSNGRLTGHMTITPSDPATEQRARAAGSPSRLEQTFDDVEVDGRRLLIRTPSRPGQTPFLSEFRLLDDTTAVMGAAVDRLPGEYRKPEFRRSFEGHRVTYTRHAPPDPAQA
jgi:hypothetical protein